MTILLNSLVGGGGVPQLAPDLTYPSSKASSGNNYESITGIDASSGLTTVLNLTGKHVVSLLWFRNMTTENNRVRLTVDGTVIWDDTYTMAAGGATPGELLLGTIVSTTSPIAAVPEVISCNTSLVLELETATDTNVTLLHMSRPIL